MIDCIKSLFRLLGTTTYFFSCILLKIFIVLSCSIAALARDFKPVEVAFNHRKIISLLRNDCKRHILT